MLMDELLKELRIGWIMGEWHWETNEWCSPEGHPTPDAAYANFVEMYNAGELEE